MNPAYTNHVASQTPPIPIDDLFRLLFIENDLFKTGYLSRLQEEYSKLSLCEQNCIELSDTGELRIRQITCLYSLTSEEVSSIRTVMSNLPLKEREKVIFNDSNGSLMIMPGISEATKDLIQTTCQKINPHSFAALILKEAANYDSLTKKVQEINDLVEKQVEQLENADIEKKYGLQNKNFFISFKRYLEQLVADVYDDSPVPEKKTMEERFSLLEKFLCKTYPAEQAKIFIEKIKKLFDEEEQRKKSSPKPF